MKKMKKYKKLKESGLNNVDQDNHFQVFVTSTKIRFSFYKETHKILGSTYGMLVLQVIFILYKYK